MQRPCHDPIPEDVMEFVNALIDYKRVNNRPFPGYHETLEVLKYLVYRKVAPKGEYQLR